MGRVVLLTGCSSGIGQASALLLHDAGWRVYAGVRTAADGERIEKARPGITALRLDVTDVDQVAVAVAGIAEGRLDGLVNSAGINVAGPVEWLSLDDWRRQLEVNVLGSLAVLHATLPMLRAAGGRVVFLGSPLARLPTPLSAPYCASKAALRALADSLRLELRGSGVGVCLIEPGLIRTPMLVKGRADAARLWVQVPPEMQDRYRTLMSQSERLLDLADARAVAPERAAAVVRAALTATRPHRYYRVGIDAWAAEVLVRLAPVRVRDWVLERGMDLIGRGAGDLIVRMGRGIRPHGSGERAS